MLVLRLEFSPEVNFAMQQNHVPVVRKIYVVNKSEESVENVSITIDFEPLFAEQCVIRIDAIAAGCEEEINNIPVRFSTSFLSELTERISGSMKVQVKVGEEDELQQTYDVDLLAFNEWQGNGVYPEITAAFVTPNHPVLPPIIKRASEILGSWTGSSALDAYQTRDPNRVKMQMAAVFEAVSEQGIAYCTAPASFDKDGQRVRLAGEVIGNRLANCMDISLFYASCLEAIGINPLIIITEGHAFAGAWLVESTFPDSVNDDSSLLTKRTAGGINEILLVEATMMLGGSRSAFDEASASAESKLLGDTDFSMFVDIARARYDHIRPLPILENGKIDLNYKEEKAERHHAPASLIATDDIDTTLKASVSKQVIWERKLLDLSLRNNLLNSRITKDSIQIMSVSINEIEDALADGSAFSFSSKPSGFSAEKLQEGVYRGIKESDDVYDIIKRDLQDKRLRTYHTDESLSKALTHLYRASRTAMEENGANTLYLALGMLKWFETKTSTRPRYAPILLLPVEILRNSAASGYVIRSRGEDTVLNITLLEMLRQFFGLQITGLDPLPVDESGVDVPLIFNTIRRFIMNQKGWDVEEQAILGLFSFNKFLMWNDIHNNVDVLAENKIVKSLLDGVVDKDVNVEITEETDLDSKYNPGSIVLPISADSSQLEAITAAASGKSFILHGPPGTGKSQTITNIIANALYNGKRVLFVAEKMAALEVVQRRLEQIGLAPFCLEMHSNKAKKSAVVEQLKRTTEVARAQMPEEFAQEAARIKALRDEINEYIDALHRVNDSGFSLYDCIARYSSFGEDVPTITLPQDVVKSVHSSKLTALEDALSELETACRIIGSPAEHPLADIHIESHPNVDFGRLFNVDNIKNLKKGIGSFAKILGIEDVESLSLSQIDAIVKIAETLLNAEYLPEQMVRNAHEEELCLAEEIISHLKEKNRVSEALSTRYKDTIAGCDADFIEASYNSAMGKGFIGRFFALGKVRTSLSAYTKDGSKPSKDVLKADIDSIVILSRQSKAVNASSAMMNDIFGRSWNGGTINPDSALNAISSVRAITGLLRQILKEPDCVRTSRESLGSSLAEGLSSFRDYNSSSLSGCVSAYQKTVEQKAELERVLKAHFTQPDEPNCLGIILSRLSGWNEHSAMLRDWTVYNRQKSVITQLGLDNVITELEAGNIPVDRIKDTFIKSFYRASAEIIINSDNRLNDFHGDFFGDKIKRFRELCIEFENMTRQEIYARLAASLPALQKEASQTSSVGILQRNIKNNCRGISLRQLLDKIQDILPRMCPCMLMSPLSVSQYIDAKGFKFDLVIFDEASQMPTCEAVGAIARGKQIIVVGDPNQMPPTSFFATNVYDEDNPDKEDLESILDDCLALSLPSKYLLWHYRSKHESLIAFSNSKYYGNKLMTFPSPDDITTKLKYQHVKGGVYDRGGTRQNKAEAVAIIEEVRKRLSSSDGSRRSIGIITFNSNQQGLIEDMLTDLFKSNPALEETANKCSEAIFVKNLENVQGDERDIILFSVGYGPDANGNVSLNFGPLNRDGGWRRLNVAVSRARYEMKVFSTLTSDQINLNRTSAEGVAGLKAFLEYAEKGRESLRYNTASSTRSDDDLVLSIASALRDKGYQVETNVGCSGYKVDIAVVSPVKKDSYSLAIICDGYNSRSARTARDREVVQQQVLWLLGWRVHRVWALDWWHNNERTMNGIIAAINNADDLPGDDEIIPFNPVKTFVAPPAAAIFEEPDPRIQEYESEDEYYFSPSAEDFCDGYYDSSVRQKIQAVIEKESPVSFGIICRRVSTAFGFAQTGSRMRRYISYTLDSMKLNHSGDPDYPFYWRGDQDPKNLNVFRPDSNRDSTDIAPEEIAVAVVMILENQGALPMEALTREVANTFNFTRLGSKVLPSMQAGINYAISIGKARLDDDKVHLG